MATATNKPKGGSTFAGAGNEDDVLLINRAAQGDRAAFDKIAAKYGERIQLLAFRHTRDPEMAKDVALEALARIYRSANTYRADAPFPTWLTRVVINCAIDSCRQRARSHTVGYEEAFGTADHMESSVEDPEWRSAFREAEVDPRVAQVIRNLIRQLEPKKRELLLLSYRDEVSYEQIGAKQSMPIGTVKSKLSRIRGELKRDFRRTWRGIVQREFDYSAA